MHNNYIIGIDSKIYREKEMLFYTVDISEYYSSTKQKYFTFTYLESNSINDIEILIWKGLMIANKSNIIFILPRILCKYCHNCHGKWCSYIDCWKIRNLNKCFSEKYRENV